MKGRYKLQRYLLRFYGVQYFAVAAIKNRIQQPPNSMSLKLLTSRCYSEYLRTHPEPGSSVPSPPDSISGEVAGAFVAVVSDPPALIGVTVTFVSVRSLRIPPHIKPYFGKLGFLFLLREWHVVADCRGGEGKHMRSRELFRKNFLPGALRSRAFWPFSGMLKIFR